MQKVLISIKPHWVNKILKKEKTLEIRKSAPTTFPCEVYIYCTKDKSELVAILPEENSDYAWVGNGRVVAKFIMDYEAHYKNSELNFLLGCGELPKALEPTCVSETDFKAYARDSKMISFWHITKLKIFDKPKKLQDFGVEIAPQSWQYIN